MLERTGAKGIIQRILHGGCLKAAAFFAHPGTSKSGSGPGPRAQFQITAGLGAQCTLEHLIPPGLPKTAPGPPAR